MNAMQTSRCSMIGLRPDEIEWVRLLVTLLRSSDPLVPELARQALDYVRGVTFPDPVELALNG
jgi:hypothetical protein